MTFCFSLLRLVLGNENVCLPAAAYSCLRVTRCKFSRPSPHGLVMELKTKQEHTEGNIYGIVPEGASGLPTGPY